MKNEKGNDNNNSNETSSEWVETEREKDEEPHAEQLAVEKIQTENDDSHYEEM